jgi:hypothetical protein
MQTGYGRSRRGYERMRCGPSHAARRAADDRASRRSCHRLPRRRPRRGRGHGAVIPRHGLGRRAACSSLGQPAHEETSLGALGGELVQALVPPRGGPIRPSTAVHHQRSLEHADALPYLMQDVVIVVPRRALDDRKAASRPLLEQQGVACDGQRPVSIRPRRELRAYSFGSRGLADASGEDLEGPLSSV